jgi:8-oxo-dGTP diphosphatase
MAQEIAEQLFIGQIRQKVLLEKDGKILLSRDVGHTNWDLPGGRLHIGEEPKTGLAREVREEIGVEVEVGEPIYTDAVAENHETRASFIVMYRGRILNPTQPFKLASDEIEEVRWVGKEEWKQFPMWDEYRRALNIYFGVV